MPSCATPATGTFDSAALARRTTVVILAGGFGTRVRHLLPDLPKPMAPVLGRPFVEWVVRFYAGFGFERFVLSTGYLAEKVEAHFVRQPVAGAVVTCLAETSPLGTAGGCLNCLPQAPDEERLWLVANGDSLLIADPVPMLGALVAGDGDAAILGSQIEDAARYGSLEMDNRGRLLGFLEKRPGAGLINAGTYAFRESALRGLPAVRPLSFEVDVFPKLAAERRAIVHRTVGAFLDIGTPETLGQAEAFISANRSRFEPVIPSPQPSAGSTLAASL